MRKQVLETNEDGSTVMNEKNILMICEKEDGLYEYPELNNKLYLNHKKFNIINGLNNFINVNTLFLNNNLIKKIENLDCLPNLTNLYLNSNMISKIENLENNKQLVNINLAKNGILVIENLTELPNLKNLDLSDNYIKNTDSMYQLKEMKSITTLDLTNNFLEYSDEILNILVEIPNLLVLYLKDNPCQRHFKSYRKQLVGYLKNLNYLDDRPIFPDERRLSEAYVEGGVEQMKKERQKLNEEAFQRKQQDIEDTKKKAYQKKKKNVYYFQQQLKQSLIEQSNLSQKIELAINQRDVHDQQFFETKLNREKENSDQIQESITSLMNSIQIYEKKEEYQQQKAEFLKTQIPVTLVEEDIDQILVGLVSKYKGFYEKIMYEFKEVVNLLVKNLHKDIESSLIETETIRQKVESLIVDYENNKKQMQQQQQSETDSYSGKNDSDSVSSLQQYDTSEDQDLQQEPTQLDDLD